MDGFYATYFTGAHGSGYAVLAMRSGVISGADPTGTSYDGVVEFSSTDESYRGTLLLRPAAGSILVTGVEMGSQPEPVAIPLRLPVDFANGQVIRIETPTGPINVTFKKLRNIS